MGSMQQEMAIISFKNNNIRIKKRGHKLPFFLVVEMLKTFLILRNLNHTSLKKASPLFSKMEN